MYDIENIDKWLAGGFSIICTFGAIYAAWIHPLVKKMLAWGRLASKTISDASQIHEIIRTELCTEDGWSLKDCLGRIEKKMFVQDNKHRAMLSLLERPVWEADEFGMFVWVNRAFVRILGRDIADLKDNGWISTVHADDRDRISDEWQDAVTQNRTFSSKYRMVKVNGDVIDCLGEAFPIESVDHSGREVSKRGFVGILSSRKF